MVTCNSNFDAASIASDESGGVLINPPGPVPTPETTRLFQPFQRPVREPRGPPPTREEVLAQNFKARKQPTGADAVKFEGFTKFIRDHSSPTAQRVTAGGRVVPVGHKSPPPTFHMDFINRLLQAAEETKQDPSNKLQSRTIKWVADTNCVGNSEEVTNDDTMSTPSSANPTIPSGESAHGLNVDEKTTGKLDIPAGFKVMADMADGSKIVKIGGTLLRAYLSNNGQTAFESMEIVDKEPLLTPKPDVTMGQTQTPNPSMQDGFVASASNPYMLVQGPNGWISASPVVDESGNITFAPAPMNEQAIQPLPAASSSHFPTPNPQAFDSALIGTHASYTPNSFHVSASGFAYNALPKLLTYAPCPSPSAAAPPELPIEMTGMSHNEIAMQLHQVTGYYQLKKSRLDAITRWLAKEEDYMPVDLKRGLYAEKGELIPSVDSLRKERENYERAYAAILFFMQKNETSKHASKPRATAPAITIQQYDGQNVSQTGISDHGALHQQVPPANALGLVPEQSLRLLNPGMDRLRASSPGLQPHRANPSGQNLLHAMAPNLLQPNAPAFVPNHGQADNSVRRVQSVASNVGTPVMAIDGYSNGAHQMALVPSPRRTSSRSNEAPAGAVPSTQPTTRRVAPRVTLSRPDGTPIDLSAVQRKEQAAQQTAQQFQQTVQHNQQGPLATYNSVGANNSPVAGLFPPARNQNQSPSNNGDKATSQPGKPHVWTRFAGETDAVFEERLEKQRSARAVKPNESLAPATTSIGTQTNENRNFSQAAAQNSRRSPASAVHPGNGVIDQRFPQNSFTTRTELPVGGRRQLYPNHGRLATARPAHAPSNGTQARASGSALVPPTVNGLSGSATAYNNTRNMLDFYSQHPAAACEFYQGGQNDVRPPPGF